jgi:hypothetical protein
MNNIFRWVPLAAVFLVALSACVTTEKRPDGSTTINIPSILQRNPAQPTAGTNQTFTPAKPAVAPNQSSTAPAQKVGTIQSTALANLFTKYPFDGTQKTYFPKVAVTVTDWTSADCWSANAKIWYSKSKSENVPSFNVCFNKSFGFALNNAANLHLFFEQSTVEHSGNVRTDGPKPPMMAVPDRFPFGDKGIQTNNLFVQQLVVETGWKPGAPTNIWIVGYNTAPALATQPSTVKTTAASPVPTSTPVSFDKTTLQVLTNVLTCTSLNKSIEKVDEAMRANNLGSLGTTPFAIDKPIKPFGLSTTKIAVSREGFEQIYRSHFFGLTLQDVVKAASLRMDSGKKRYQRVTKLGVLMANEETDGVSLTCVVQSE